MNSSLDLPPAFLSGAASPPGFTPARQNAPRRLLEIRVAIQVMEGWVQFGSAPGWWVAGFMRVIDGECDGMAGEP